MVFVSGTGFTSSVSGNVWFDTNGNFVLDGGEPSAAVTTDASGKFTTPLTVPTVPGGSYKIRADVPQEGR